MLVAIAVAGSLVLAGCSSATSTGSVEPVPTPTATESVSREAGWFQNRIRVCVQNKTSRNLEYAFDDDVLDDEDNYLSQPRGTMGPNAFVCGASMNRAFLMDAVAFRYKNTAGNWDQLLMRNSAGEIRLSINGSWDEFDFVLTGGKPLTTVVNGHTLDVLLGTSMRTFDQLTAYPMDVRIYDAP
jgi:hypothetical protein